MSHSGYRGRNFGPRGARTNGPPNGYSGPRFLHPTFNHLRPRHRLPGHEKWIEGPNFSPWQQNNNFLSHLQYRGNLQFRPNGRGRVTGGRGIVRFSGPGRPPASQFSIGYKRNPIPRTSLSQGELTDDKSTLVPQVPLLGSEEERQQKISETADKLKQKLSSITAEELTNFWEDDLSILSNHGLEEDNTRKKGIPELRHEPPELDLTFTDFRDIGRVDCNNSKFDNVDNKCNDEISVGFRQNSIDKDTSTDDEITIIDENKEEYLIALDSVHQIENFKPVNMLLGDDKCAEQMHHKLSDFERNTENLQNHNPAKNLIPSNLNNESSPSNVADDITNLAPIESVNLVTTEQSTDVNNIEAISALSLVTSDKDELEVNFAQNENTVQIDTKDENNDDTQGITGNGPHDHYREIEVFEDNQDPKNVETNLCQKTVCETFPNIFESCQNRPHNLSHLNKELHLNTAYGTSTLYSTYNEVHKLNDDQKFSQPVGFQSKLFSTTPRLAPRIGGTRGHWAYPQNGKNVFFRGSPRLPFHSSRISLSKHVASFQLGYDPRAPPSFTSTDLLPVFDPSEPPPNIRPTTEMSTRQGNIQTISVSDSRSQTVNSSQNHMKVVQPPPAFDPRGPPPRISNISVTINEKLPEFNPQQPPPKIQKREDTLQPPPIFDPRLSSQERSNLITPLDSSRSKLIPINLVETSQITDYGSVAPNFSQLAPINMPSHQTFIPNVQMNFQPILSQTNSAHTIIRDFALPPPPINITDAPPPPPKEPLVESNSNPIQNINMDDGLEDMQEAMEFAKQIMNMTEKTSNESASMFSKVPLTPTHISVPNEGDPHFLCPKDENTSIIKQQKKRESKSKKGKSIVVYEQELIVDKQREIETEDVEQSIQNKSKISEDALLSNDQIRPKVVFNLNSKTKKIHKPEEWHRPFINISENKDIFHQAVSHNINKTKIQSGKNSSENRSNLYQNKNKPKESNKKVSPPHNMSQVNVSVQEKPNEKTHHRDKSLEKSYSHSSSKVISNANIQESQKVQNDIRKMDVLTLETSWKNRVINRFLKMSKNDICNMVNNSSLRKFDIAMKHLVKERRTSLSLEMRNTEDEKMKEYDREEFMTQLNAMLDPSAIVAITDLPTEFIHHLSEVLQLDRMPLDTEHQNTSTDEIKTRSHNEVLTINNSMYCNEENPRIEPSIEYKECQNMSKGNREIENEFTHKKEEPVPLSFTSELNLHYSRDDTSSPQRSLTNKISFDVESPYKKQQQPLFNEADLDDILSEVTEKTKNFPNTISLVEVEKATETCTGSSLKEPVITDVIERNSFSQIANKTAADLGDIFLAGVAEVKLFDKNNIDSDNSRLRKSSSEDRSIFRSERYERWNRKEQDDADTFRNLTKEEWEAKYGATNSITIPTVTRKSISNSAENLSRDNSSFDHRSNSPIKHVSLSPLTHEASVHKSEKCNLNEVEDLRRAGRSESSSDFSSTSSSDSNEETVEPNVTKLLKVIKEKEKIAKKKSLNETIRDEVAAEIEKKWKEKSKYKERKSRKRERRKKDKKNKRKKEKRIMRKQSSYSDSSKSCEQLEICPFLTEDEVKKEVIVKEELMSSVEDNIPFDNGMDNSYIVPTLISRVTDTQTESQNLQVGMEEIPAISRDIALMQSKNKLTNVSMSIQPKTKAQLKQMPEANEADSEQVMEESANPQKNNSIMNTPYKEVNKLLKVNTDTEIAKSIDEGIADILSTSIFFNQSTIPFNIKESSSNVEPHIETTCIGSTMHPPLPTSKVSNLVTELNSNNHCAEQKAYTSTSATEHKTGAYKKIDIKAYKERTLQRRLKEQAMLKENPINSTVFVKDLHSSPLNETNVESISTMNETLTIDIDNTKLQSKDPRLSRIKLITTHSLEDSNQEIKVKPLEDFEHQPQNVFQENAESVASVQVRSKERNMTQVGEADLNICIDSTKYIQLKNIGKSLSQDNIGACDFEANWLNKKSNIKLEDKNSKKSIELIDSSKFKNIRSEGGKELKLKKEKVKKSTEKKKKDFKPNESKSLVAKKHLEKYSYKVLESNQEPLNGITNITIPKDIEKVDNLNNSGKISKLQTKFSTDSEIIQEQIDINFVVQQDNCNNITGDVKLPNISEEGILQVNEKIIKKKEIVDKGIITNVSKQNLQCLESKINDIEEIETNSSKITEVSEKQSQPTSTESSNEQNNVDKSIMPLNSVSFGGIEKCKDTEFLVSNYVSEETLLLSEHVTVDVEKSNSAKIECLQNIMEHKNKEEYSAIKCISHLNEFVKDSGNCNKVGDKEARSPDSPSSPFKGFLTDSLENKTCQVSQSHDIKLNSKSDKENLNYSKHWLETCFDNKFILQSTTGDKDGIKCNFKGRKNEKRTSLSNLMEVQKDATERMNDNLDVIDTVNITGMLDMENNRRLKEEDGESLNIISKPERFSFAVNIDSQCVYDEESEPFIVLDEYIDDTDGKSIEKLSASDLDFEECIARDADIFMNTSVQGEENLLGNLKSSNFNTVNFKELSDVLDKNNVNTEQNEGSATNVDEKLKNMLSGRGNIIATDIVSSTSESNIESNINLINSTASEGPIESSQNIISTTSKDSSQRFVMPEVSSVLCKRNMDRIAECSNKTQAVGSDLENEISLKSSNPVKCKTEFVLDLITNAEFSEFNKPNNKLNKVQVLKNSPIDGKISPSLKIGIPGDKDTSFDSISEKELSKNRTKVTSNITSRQENHDTLHKIKSRSKMKNKKQKCDTSAKVLKKVVNSDFANIKCPSTKEAIMARMIEIDVEIHKLMTEKMTLYQMLTSGVLPTDNHLQNKKVMQKENVVKAAIIRPETPSALMSQLLQNIETSPVNNQCTKTAKQNTGTKDSSINSTELNENRIESKHYHYTENKGRYTSSCDSEGNEISHQLDNAGIPRKKNRSKLEKVVKKSQNKLDITIPGKDMQHTNTEKKRTDDLKKSESKKISFDNKIRQSTIELEFSQVSINDAQSQQDISKISEEEISKENSLNNGTIEASKSQEVEGTLKSTESGLLSIGIADIKAAALSEGNCLSKDNNEGTETLNKKNINVNSSTSIVENRTPERSIYSDDSTWDSFLQTSSMDGQNKPSTGLALLEETYRKEMAKIRKVKIEDRKKKKRFQNLEQAVQTLTPEEEELPLSALYIKKFHQKKKVQNSMDQQTKQQQNDDPELWKNLDDVINAVAENRTGDLYAQTLEQASQAVIKNIVADTPNLEENFKSKQGKDKRKINPTLQKAKEDCSDIQINVEISYKNKSEASNDSEIDCPQLSSNKSQELASNKDFEQDLGINVSSKFINETLSIPVNNKSTDIEMNAVQFSKQTVESNDAGNNQQTSTIGHLDVCLKVSSPNRTQDNQKSLNIVKNIENAVTVAEGKEGREDKETDLQTPIATIEKTLLQESTDSQLVIISENVERSTVAQTKLNKGKDTTALSGFMSKEQFTSNLQNAHEDKVTDSSAAIEKDNNVSNTVEEQNDVSQDEHFINLKEYKESQSRKETDHYSTTSSEESSNQNSACCTSTGENADILKNEEILGKKLQKRKRGSSRTSLRRSSRYSEELTKRIKLEVDTSLHNLEQQLQEKNTGTQLLSISPTSLSPCEETENLLPISRKSRGTQKLASSRKRCTPIPPESEIISHEASVNNEFIKGIKRYKQHTISKMMNCVVRLVDCRHTILNLTASPDLLQKYGISKINTYACSNSTQIDSFTSPVQLTSIKDLPNVCTKQPTSVTEFLQVQTSKLLKKSNNTTQPASEQINTTKVRKILKSTQMDSFVNDEEEYTEPDIELVPVLAKEPVIVGILQNCKKPDIEIVEEKTIITKNQQHINPGLTLTVINTDTKDDKELPRTQYTVHKGPILDIKVFENSFLAASEDGRVYRYNQTSNGILNIYKGHTAAVTCLYVYNASSIDISKEWMFSGSLDGTLQCYNILTGIQMRDTADIGSPIQCMDEAWGTIFIGTKSGHVSRYHIKSGIIKGSSIQFSDKSVLALKATNEGPRRVLIVASRSQPITIRDAQSGLFLRTICGQKSHTVYSLMRDTNLIYCGTSSTSIPVFDFTNGEQTMQYDAGVGIVCMRMYKQLLFAGCYDGNIYVFNTQDHRLVCSVPGPGNMLLSMEVIGNKIIAGSKDKRLQSWQMPRQVRSLL